MKLLLHDYGNFPFIRQLARSLAMRGHDVHFVYSESTQLIKRSENGLPVKNLTITGITLKKPFEKYDFLRRRACEIEHGRQLAELIHNESPDVVLSANSPLDVQAFALRASHENNAKFVFWMQDAVGLATKESLKKIIPFFGLLIGEYYENLEKHLVKTSDYVVLISEDFLPLVSTWGVDRLITSVIPNWAPLEEIRLSPKKNAWAQEHHLADSFCFIYTGILGLKHNPGLFLQLAEAFARSPDVKVVIVTEGSSAKWLERETLQRGLTNLVVLPSQPQAVYEQVLGTASVLMSVITEDAGKYSAPSKVLSYMCAGRPLLLAVPLSNLSARRVIESGSGLVCAPSDNAGWIENARRLFKDGSFARSLGRNARQYAEATFNIQRITAQFEEIIFGLHVNGV